MQSEEKQFSGILRQVIDNYGPELLNDIARFNALLMDYAPNHSKERKLLCAVLRENVLPDLQNAALLGEEESERIITRCIFRIKNDLWLSEDAAIYAIQLLSSSLGIILSEVYNSRQKDEERTNRVLSKENQTVTQANINGLLDGYNAIGYKAFACNDSITEIHIPDSVTVVFPRAFLNCVSLRTISFPGTIQKIGNAVFYGCTQLQSIDVQPNGRYAVINGALIDKDTATLIRVVNASGKMVSVVPQIIRRIASYAYDHSTVTEIHLSNRVEAIEENAFNRCDSLEKICITGYSSFFRSCKGVLHDGTGKVLMKYPPGCKQKLYIIEEDVEIIHSNAFSRAKYLEALTFNSSLRAIGRKAFDKCVRLESLILPSNINEIGERAFQDCISLKSIMLPRGILQIGDYAFNGCSSLASLSIPASVERIGHGAFAGCVSLTTITFQKKILFIGDGAFEECSKDIIVKIHSNPYVEAYCKAHEMKFENI